LDEQKWFFAHKTWGERERERERERESLVARAPSLHENHVGVTWAIVIERSIPVDHFFPSPLRHHRRVSVKELELLCWDPSLEHLGGDLFTKLCDARGHLEPEAADTVKSPSFIADNLDKDGLRGAEIDVDKVRDLAVLCEQLVVDSGSGGVVLVVTEKEALRSLALLPGYLAPIEDTDLSEPRDH